MTYNVFSGTLNPTHLLTCCLLILVRLGLGGMGIGIQTRTGMRITPLRKQLGIRMRRVGGNRILRNNYGD